MIPTPEVATIDYQQAMEQANQAFSALGDMPRHPLANRPYLTEVSGRPGDLMPVLEDEHGTYIMNSKALRAVEHIERLVKIGVDSLKIEGRTKPLYYVARTAQFYRRAIDDAVAERPFDERLLGELQGLGSQNTGFASNCRPFSISEHDENVTVPARSHPFLLRSETPQLVDAQLQI